MNQLLNLLEGTLFLNKLSLRDCPINKSKLLRRKSRSYKGNFAEFQKYRGAQSSLQGGSEIVDSVESSLEPKEFACDDEELEALPHVQTLRNFPKEELLGKVVMVRFDSTILLREELNQRTQSVTNAVYTIKYLLETGAKVILVSDWTDKNTSKPLVGDYIADFLSSVLKHEVVCAHCINYNMLSKMEGLEKADIIFLENLSNFKEEVANCSKFAELLSSEVDIFVNDCFSQSHRTLASTVGVTRFCFACLAGFHFEESLCLLKRAAKTNKKPYIAIIGGRNLSDKAAAMHFLASRCDGMVFVGLMSFQIMHALGLPVPWNSVEHGALKEALDIIQFAQDRKISILYPKDFWCKNDHFPNLLEIFPAYGIPEGWVPVDLGPISLDEINSLLTKCKKIIWIGPVKFVFSSQYTTGASKLAQLLIKASQSDCDVIAIGNMACKSIMKESSFVSDLNMIENASVVWEFLKGRKLPGIIALDRAYPFKIDWNATYHDPAQPLVVDIGSGNGLFLLGMARRRKDLNFLGLEINEKLVNRCLGSVHQSGIKNGYFIATNATSTFRSIVSSYPGALFLVSIQCDDFPSNFTLPKEPVPFISHENLRECPNPDFNKPDHRWRMLQRPLVEAVADLLMSDGKVFLQSDIEAVAVRMKDLFLKYGKGKLAVLHDQDDTKIPQGGWLEENPFGIRSDWEQHVIDRGAPMYRLMLYKSTCVL